MFPDANVAARSLVKLNSGEVDEIRSAIGVGLNGVYASDGYVYYQDGSWHGFSGNYGSNDQPYLVCPIHNENSWLEHEENQPPEEGGEDISGGNPDDNYWEGEYDG